MATLKKITSPQTLLIDADDTLWENNIYFERAIANFISYLNHQEFSPREVREVLNEVERECVVKHGYGLRSFTHALVNTFERLAVDPVSPAIHETICAFAHAIAEHPIEMFDSVPETLEYLASRHQLILVTKGNMAEQSAKIERSGLQTYFKAVEVVPEKDEPAYRNLIGRYQLEPAATWMVGNSPKSDINPALHVGLNAVYVPHEMTWILERCEIADGPHDGTLVTVTRFADLRQLF